MLKDRLRQLRLARGLTLDELTELMDGAVTKQALSKYETGKSFPRPTTLIALAKALRVSASDLIAEPEYSVVCLQFRSRAPLASRTRERVEATLKVDLEKRLKLEDRLNPERRPRVGGEQIAMSSFEDTESFALGLREAWGLGVEPIANLSEVFERNSIHVFELDGEVDFDGLAAVAHTEAGELRAIGIAENPDTFGDRQRFNLAHELGHVLLRSDVLDEERVADRFAGAFLVPGSALREDVGVRRTEIAWEELILLKQRWGASMQCLLHRLCDLDIISDGHYEWWRREINALGYQRVEPAPFPRETSTWAQRQLARAQAEGTMSQEQRAAYATTPGERTETVLSRKSLAALGAADRHAILKEHAERLAADYERELDREWLEADLGDD